MKEIGSDFWITELCTKDNKLDFLNIGNDYKLFMSGRTAIDYVINQLIDVKKIVYMPNYCCESMAKPFTDNGYSIAYYEVDLINNIYKIDTNFDCSIFFAMSYFGYNTSNMDSYIEKFSKRGITVVEDITHRFLCNKNHSKYSTYLICSLRKWFPVLSGGIAISLNEPFKKSIDNYTINAEFIKYKKHAMQLKHEYMYDIKKDCKDEFLELFKKSNKFFSDYKNKKIDGESLEILRKIDLDEIKEKRIQNTKVIENYFKDTNNIKLLYRYKRGDCPLFVPIIVKDRDNIRKKLIEKNIYCPVHWPQFNNSSNNLYKYELSLVCDQRYDKKELEEEVKILFKDE